MEPNDSWSESTSYWQRHPVLVWMLELVVGGVLLFTWYPDTPLYITNRLLHSLVFFPLGLLVLKLREKERRKNRLRPSPFLFWWQ
jgi:hypothetical protein